MTACAAVMTAAGSAAIATIGLWGDGAEPILRKIFRSAGPTWLKTQRTGTGAVWRGNIVRGQGQGQETIDEVVVGREREDFFAIHCHGNPVIVEMIMDLLAEEGARPVGAERMLEDVFADTSRNTIELEAGIEQLKTLTYEGAVIIAAQASGGLAKAAKDWLTLLEDPGTSENGDGLPPAEQVAAKIQGQCRKILEQSRIAGLIIRGCRVVIAGPPNSGKSTLLNCLSGKHKAIVADVPGTTRDWISVWCRIEGMAMELFDTAGIEQPGAETDGVERQSQTLTAQLVGSADIVLFVLDGSAGFRQLPEELLRGKKVLLVINKSDLPVAATGTAAARGEADFGFGRSVHISALHNRGIDELVRKIREVAGVAGFDANQAVCLTKRQEKLAGRIARGGECKTIKLMITELLKGRV